MPVEDHKVGPGDFLAVFLLDRPQQAARLVEVRVVRPAIERREALLAASGAAAAIANAVGARAVPGHADEQAAIVAEVGRPPILRVRHQGVQVLDHGVQVEALELLGVIEVLAHRIGQGGVLVKNLNVRAGSATILCSSVRGSRPLPGICFRLPCSLLLCGIFIYINRSAILDVVRSERARNVLSGGRAPAVEIPYHPCCSLP